MQEFLLNLSTFSKSSSKRGNKKKWTSSVLKQKRNTLLNGEHYRNQAGAGPRFDPSHWCCGGFCYPEPQGQCQHKPWSHSTMPCSCSRVKERRGQQEGSWQSLHRPEERHTGAMAIPKTTYLLSPSDSACQNNCQDTQPARNRLTCPIRRSFCSIDCSVQPHMISPHSLFCWETQKNTTLQLISIWGGCLKLKMQVSYQAQVKIKVLFLHI